MKDKEEILRQAKEEAQKWVSAFSLDGKYNKDVVLQELKNRKFRGENVLAFVVDSPKEAAKLITELAEKSTNKKTPEILSNGYLCIWSYYDMAFYECLYSQIPDKTKIPEDYREFFDQSFIKAFKEGLGFIINFGSLVVGVMRPIAYQDENLNIHRESGPAIIWGEELQYWWHGVRVEASWIEHPETINPKEAFNHPNIEQRRAICEIVGWDKIVDHCGAKVLQKDDYGELLSLESDNGEVRFVRVVCPTTGRIYVLCVPNDVNEAHEGVARGFGMKKEEYNPVIQT